MLFRGETGKLASESLAVTTVPEKQERVRKKQFGLCFYFLLERFSEF